ncbi:MAG: signal peptidase II [Caldisericaceae bacterium]
MEANDKWIFWIVASLVVIVDQASKLIVRSKLSVGHNIPILGRIFSIEYLQNPGALFGLFPSLTKYFIVMSIIAIILIGFITVRFPFSRFVLVSFGLMIGGISGNLIDRIVFGYVTDFLYITHWPIFNIADSAIDVGIAIFVYYVLRYGKYF